MDTEQRLQRLSERYPGLPAYCGNESRPGVVDDSIWGDFSNHHTTPDQVRIEEYLIGQDLRGARILHVGVGNSSFGRRFHSSAGFILGTTIVETERQKALALGLPRYDCIVHNKYFGADERIGGGYRFVVDNSPTAYACCLNHFERMMEAYANMLAPGGQILTDQLGLGFRLEPNPSLADFSFDFDDLAATAPLFGLTAYRIDETVYAMAHEPPLPSSKLCRARFKAHRLIDKVRARSRYA